ncbi:MAG: response regulator [Magnetococcales bacterium]|nr:response regulator [Magnetococcales bacterium]
MKCLIVDDYLENRQLLFGFLQAYGKCDMAVHGGEAVDLFADALESGEPYDLVLLDIMMPEMNGQVALQQMRSLEKEYGMIGANEAVIIMVTALDSPWAATDAFFKGYCTDYLTKPITKQILIEKLLEYRIIIF